MLGLNHHGDAARLKNLINRVGDLGCEMLLRLQAVCEDIDDAG